MRDLTDEELKEIISDRLADYGKEICLFIPENDDQPVVMYTNKTTGKARKHYLCNSLKTKYQGGLYFYLPRVKSFDITQHEWSDITMTGYQAAKLANGCLCLNGASKSKILNRDDAIAIAKHFKLKAEDLK